MFEIAAFDGDAFHQFNRVRVGMASEPYGCHESQVTQTAARFECDYFQIIVVDGSSGHQISYQATEVADAHRQELRDFLHPGSGAAGLHEGCGEDRECVRGPKTKDLDYVVRVPQPLFQPWVQPRRRNSESVSCPSYRDRRRVPRRPARGWRQATSSQPSQGMPANQGPQPKHLLCPSGLHPAPPMFPPRSVALDERCHRRHMQESCRIRRVWLAAPVFRRFLSIRLGSLRLQ